MPKLSRLVGRKSPRKTRKDKDTPMPFKTITASTRFLPMAGIALCARPEYVEVRKSFEEANRMYVVKKDTNACMHRRKKPTTTPHSSIAYGVARTPERKQEHKPGREMWELDEKESADVFRLCPSERHEQTRCFLLIFSLS